MIIGIAISIGMMQGNGGVVPPPPDDFANTQWQLYNANTWENITDTWT